MKSLGHEFQMKHCSLFQRAMLGSCAWLKQLTAVTVHAGQAPAARLFLYSCAHCQSLSSWVLRHVLHWWLCYITTGILRASFPCSSVMPLTVTARILHGEMNSVGWICCILLKFVSFGGLCVLIIFPDFNFSRVPCVGNKGFLSMNLSRLLLSKEVIFLWLLHQHFHCLILNEHASFICRNCYFPPSKNARF